MVSFSENYYLRQHYLENEQVPIQSVIKQKMTPNLAAVMFKFLDPKLKVLAGLEPPLKGGGSDWYVCPKEILINNRAVLKPLDHDHLTKLNHSGIVHFGLQALAAHKTMLDNEENMRVLESDAVWKDNVGLCYHKFWDENVLLQSKNNTEYINNAFDEFSSLYRTSLNNIEELIHEEIIKDIKKIQEDARLKMKNRYSTLLKCQAISLTDNVTAKLKQDKERLKAEFIEQLEISRAEMTEKYHDLQVDKRAAVEKLRRFLECQKLACQMFVVLKEKEECCKETEESKHKHKKKIRCLTEDSILKTFELTLAEQKDKKQQELNSIWLKKVSHVVKKFQMYVSYCLSMLPNYAEFFINMEKLMLLQVNEALENPTAESIIAIEEEAIHTPVPQAKPFYVFCDIGYKAKVHQELCPKHSGTSSTAQLLPAVIINKRCMYAACDNFEQFTNKIKDFFHGYDADMKDEVIYEHFVPVKYTSSQQLKERKLESSLLQVLQQEMSNINEVASGVCAGCGVPHCFCTSVEDTKKPVRTSQTVTEEIRPLPPLSTKNVTVLSDRSILKHEREPKIKSYMEYIEPKTCGCIKSSKKHLTEHLPVYMRNMSMYETAELPNYETCSVTTLKKLVKQAKAKTSQRSPPISATSSKTKDMYTQYSDEEFNWLCTCFSHGNTDLSSKGLVSKSEAQTDDQFGLNKMSPSYMTSKPSSFAIDRAHSLRQLIEEAPELIEIFNKKK